MPTRSSGSTSGSRQAGTRRLPDVADFPTYLAFDSVVVEYGPAVLRACRSLVGPDDAEDLWSDTFLSALRSYDGADPPDNALAWLLVIARRRSVDHWRTRGRRTVTGSGLPDHEDRAIEHRLADTDDGLLALLRTLPAKQRSAVAYRYLADLAYDEIAELIGSSPTAARRSAADGIARLRAAYVEEGEQHEHLP